MITFVNDNDTAIKEINKIYGTKVAKETRNLLEVARNKRMNLQATYYPVSRMDKIKECKT